MTAFNQTLNASFSSSVSDVLLGAFPARRLSVRRTDQWRQSGCGLECTAWGLSAGKAVSCCFLRTFFSCFPFQNKNKIEVEKYVQNIMFKKRTT